MVATSLSPAKGESVFWLRVLSLLLIDCLSMHTRLKPQGSGNRDFMERGANTWRSRYLLRGIVSITAPLFTREWHFVARLLQQKEEMAQGGPCPHMRPTETINGAEADNTILPGKSITTADKQAAGLAQKLPLACKGAVAPKGE